MTKLSLPGAIVIASAILATSILITDRFQLSNNNELGHFYVVDSWTGNIIYCRGTCTD